MLRIVREEIKPARGVAHARAEEAYVRAAAGSKVPAYWVGMNAITGPSEAWFISSHASNEALEKENDALEAAVAKQMEAADEGDAQFRTGTRMYLLELDESLSYGQAFLEVRKALKAAHEKANVDEHWAFYEVTSGAPSGTYMLLFGSSTMKDGDTDPHTAAYRDAVGDEGRAKYQEFQRTGVASSEFVTFEISPRMSHVPAEWISERPGFWKAPSIKTTMATPKAPAVVPASQAKP